MKIQQTIEVLTTELWDTIELANKLNTKYGEETITDIMLLNLAKLKNYNLRIIQTPKDKERFKGTDWEWFIGSQNYGWVRFAIQAKKADPNSKKGDYNCLTHSVGIDEQYSILLKFSTANNAIPLYCFYNHFPKATELEHWHCKKGYNQKLLGWTVSTVDNVKTALTTRGGKNFDFIHKQKETIPVKCLFDCSLFINKFQDINLIDKKISFFGTEVTKIKTLPSAYLEQRDLTLDTFPEQLYNKEIKIYPKRIAIFDIEKEIEETKIYSGC